MHSCLDAVPAAAFRSKILTVRDRNGYECLEARSASCNFHVVQFGSAVVQGRSMGWLHGTLHVQILEARDLPMDDNLGINLASKVPGQSKIGSAFGSVLRSAERAAGEGSSPTNRLQRRWQFHFALQVLSATARAAATCGQDLCALSSRSDSHTYRRQARLLYRC